MKIRLTAMALMLGIGCIASPAYPADAEAEPSDLPEATLAKFAKARAKASTLGSSSQRRSGGSSSSEGGGISDCGVNIGNSINAPRGSAPKEIIVVVKGDVINANNRCK